MTLIKFKSGTTRELLRDSMIPASVMSMFDNFFNENAAKFERNVFFTPRVDVAETTKAFEVHVTLPGMKKEEIEIEIAGDMLNISGERKLKKEQNEAKYHMVESFYGKFSRSFNLPENINKTAISAELTDGVLKIELPKSEAKENKATITIK